MTFLASGPTGAALRVSPERFLDYAGVTETTAS